MNFDLFDQKLKDLGLQFKEIKLKPCNPYSFNKEKNSIVFFEPNIKDNCNYLIILNKILEELDPNKPLHFIAFAPFIPMNLIFFLKLISQEHQVFIYIDKKDFDSYKSVETKNLKILSFYDAEKLDLIQRK
jgi:hypothetical protein